MATGRILFFKCLFTCSTLLMVVLTGAAQSCTGSLGDPVVNETYGAGSNFGPRLPAGTTSSLEYQPSNCPEDGYYSITNYTSGCWPLPDVAWHTITDHTGDPNGYFMLVNASFKPSDFYIKNVTGLCEGTIFQFSSWIMNICSNRGRQPNITFTIERPDGAVLASYQSGNIPSSPYPLWIKYSFYFTTPVGVSDVVLRMRNNAPGGVGNDVALDDIIFRPVGPAIQLGIRGFAGNNIAICESNQTNVQLFSIVESCYVSTAYQWQISTDNQITWTDISGATTASYTHPATATGTCLYRLTVAQAGNNNNIACRVFSSALSVTVRPNSRVTISDSICQGQTYLGYGNSGTYIDTFVNANGCDSIRTLHLTILSKPDPKLGHDIDICAGDTITLIPGQFGSYLWQDGSTKKHFIVKHSGQYAVTVTNACGSAKDKVTVNEKNCNIYFPNAFTPNNDNKNDLFKILNAYNLQLYHLTIYNRWGQKVFNTKNADRGWDGTYNGQRQAPGVYIWTCSYKQNSVISNIKGMLFLIR